MALCGAVLGWPMLAEATVRRVDVLAYFYARKEREIVVDPGDVRDVVLCRL